MKFHVIHKHSPESCLLATTGGPAVKEWHARAKDVGVELVAAVATDPGHTLFFIVETDDVKKLNDFFAPMLGIGTAEITPVLDMP